MQKSYESNNEANKIVENEPEEDTGAVGGIIRSILRRAGLVTRVEAVGRLPVRIPTRVVARSADRLGQLHDVHGALTTAHKEVQSRNPISRVQAAAHTILLASRDMLKAGVLGAILFAFYEQVTGFALEFGILPTDEDYTNLRTFVVSSSSVCAITGGLSGALHGTLNCAWDHTTSEIRKFRQQAHPTLQRIFRLIGVDWNKFVLLPAVEQVASPRMYTVATALSHSLVHGSLFGCYELTKRLTLYAIGLQHNGEDISRVEGCMCILLGGACAGAIAEAVGARTLELETHGIQAVGNELQGKLKDILRNIVNRAQPRGMKSKADVNNRWSVPGDHVSSATSSNQTIKQSTRPSSGKQYQARNAWQKTSRRERAQRYLGKKWMRAGGAAGVRSKLVAVLKVTVPTALGFLASEYASDSLPS